MSHRCHRNVTEMSEVCLVTQQLGALCGPSQPCGILNVSCWTTVSSLLFVIRSSSICDRNVSMHRQEESCGGRMSYCHVDMFVDVRATHLLILVSIPEFCVSLRLSGHKQISWMFTSDLHQHPHLLKFSPPGHRCCDANKISRISKFTIWQVQGGYDM